MKRLLVLVLIASSGCFVDPAGPPPPMGPPPQGGFGPVAGGPPPGGGGPTMAGGPIEAGCSFNGTQLRGDVGATFDVACPAGCESTAGLWGTDVYTADSGICRAAIHAGLISPGGGIVSVRLEPGRPAYRGSVRNGMQSADYGQYGKSFVLGPSGQAAGGPPPPPPGYAAPPPVQAVEAGCSFNAGQLRGEIGSSHLVNCPPGCSNTGNGLWGSDAAYTADSGVCRAAIHAGLITDAGGNVVVTLDPGRPAYRGSVRNGVRSGDYGYYGKSFHLSRP